MATLAKYESGAWSIPEGSDWQIPAGDQQRHEVETRGPWGIVSKIRAVAMDAAGNVYGMRSLSAPRESGYCHEGRVSIGGKSYRGFTSSTLFVRADGTLCDVAVIHACNGSEWPAEMGITRSAP